MAVINVENLEKSYGGRKVIDGISFAVEKGETFALLGPNGVGKTTTIEILEGYRKRDGGSVDLLGYDPGRNSKAFRQKIGLVLQSSNLEDELTARETVMAFARYYPNALDSDAVIDLVGLTEQANVRVGRLSGGQQRRLEIAIGLVGDPEILFLDEPTTGLDPDARRKVWKLILDLNARGKTIMLTSHYMDEVEFLAHRTAIMLAGKIITSGTPAELQQRHSKNAVIRFPLHGGTVPDTIPAPLRKLIKANRSFAVMKARDPVPVLSDLANWAFRHQYDLTALTVSRPSLEEIYLQLTEEEAKSEAA